MKNYSTKKDEINTIKIEQSNQKVKSLKNSFNTLWPIMRSLLKGLVVLSLIYLIISPFYPHLEFLIVSIFNPIPKNENEEIEDVLGIYEQDDDNSEINRSLQNSNVDLLIIPKIQVKVPVYKSNDENDLNRGAWLKENSVSPGNIGNLIITGHKFIYFRNVRPFYFLYKLQKGDNIYIVWKKMVYKYEVKESFVVNDKDVWIENQSNNAVLTLYTCEGFDAKRRRVIRSDYIENFPIHKISDVE